MGSSGLSFLGRIYFSVLMLSLTILLAGAQPRALLPSDLEGARHGLATAAAKDDAGHSERLGNLIDYWWYRIRRPGHLRGIGPAFINKTLEDINATDAMQCPHTGRCFGRHLLANETAMAMGAHHNQPAKIEAVLTRMDACALMMLSNAR
jgi:hypothetical protein